MRGRGAIRGGAPLRPERQRRNADNDVQRRLRVDRLRLGNRDIQDQAIEDDGIERDWRRRNQQNRHREAEPQLERGEENAEGRNRRGANRNGHGRGNNRIQRNQQPNNNIEPNNAPVGIYMRANGGGQRRVIGGNQGNRQPQGEPVLDGQERDNQEELQRGILGNGPGRGNRHPRGMGRQGERGHGDGRGRANGRRFGTGGRPIRRMTARHLRELQNQEPSAIALTLANSDNGFKDALDSCPITLLLDVIAKAFTCHSTKGALNSIYITIKEKGFFNSIIGYFMAMINEESEAKREEFKQPIADMITIMEELIVKNPNSMTEFVGK